MPHAVFLRKGTKGFWLHKVWMAGVRLALWLLCLGAAAHSGELFSENELNARQTEVLARFRSYAPEGAAGGTWMLGVWDSDDGFDELVVMPSGTGNAAANFVKLEELYRLEEARVQRGDPDVDGVRELLAAAEAAHCRLAPDYYPPFTTVNDKQPDFMILRYYLGSLLKHAERLEAVGDRLGAERAYQAALICGRHLTNDRYSAIVYITGMIFKLRGAQEYERFLRRIGNPVKAEAAKGYAARMMVLLKFSVWKTNEALSDMDDFACLPTTILVATGDSEVCWRKEAVVRLAMIRHGVPDKELKTLTRNPKWERLAEKALSLVVATDQDASVRALAAWAALNVRPENYESMTHVFP